MAMKSTVTINSINVDSSVVAWVHDDAWVDEIGEALIEVAGSIAVTPSVGQTVTIKRGFTTATDEFVFQGEITQIKNTEGTNLILVCKDPLNDAIKSRRVKSWDKDIDSSAGVGSEIFKDIADHCSLDYDTTTVPSTGTGEPDKIVKFIQNGEDDFQKMRELATRYNRTILWKPETQKVYFIDKGFTVYGHTLVVGTDIPGQIKWKENMEQLVNQAKIRGVTVYDKIVETSAGPADEFTLSKTPEDTEVRINHATTDDLQTRGQKDVGVIGTDFDYYVDVEQKKIVFSAAVSDFWINYGAQVPMPVSVKNTTSIDLYGGPNKIPHSKEYTFTDIKDIADAETRARNIIQKFSLPFNQAESIPIANTTLETYGNIEPGYLVTIEDSFNDKNLQVLVSRVVKSWPHKSDLITVGDEEWRTESWQVSQMEKVNQLFNQLNKNEGILISALDLYNPVELKRYSFTISKVKICDSFILGHPINGLLGMGEILDDFEAGSAATWSGTALTLADDTSPVVNGSRSMSVTIGSITDKAMVKTVSLDLSAYTGVATGAPTQGCVGLWIYVTDLTVLDSMPTIYLRTDASNYLVVGFRAYKNKTGYENWPPASTLDLQLGWNYLVAILTVTASVVGTIDWTNITSLRIFMSPGAGYATGLNFDYLTISESNYIGLNGLGYRTSPAYVEGGKTFPLTFPITFTS